MNSTPWSTLFLDVPGMVALVRRIGIRPLMRAMFAAMADDYLRWEEFEKSARLAVHSPDGVIELMPIADATQFSFKYVNGHPGNPAIGLPTVMAFGALADVATGYPVLLSEMTLLTAIRTAAASALAASVLARPDSTAMAVIGNGAQSEFQILAFAEMLEIRQFRLYDVDAAATAKVIRNLAGFTDIECVACESVAAAIAGVDIITTATADKTKAVILNEADLRPGLHINGIGGDCPGKTELSAAVLARARVVVQFEPQSRIEGDLQQMPAEYQATELWQILAGRVPGRQSSEQVTIFDSVGFSIEDFSALRTVLGLAREHGLGQKLDLIPALPDVKDLYSLII